MRQFLIFKVKFFFIFANVNFCLFACFVSLDTPVYFVNPNFLKLTVSEDVWMFGNFSQECVFHNMNHLAVGEPLPGVPAIRRSPHSAEAEYVLSRSEYLTQGIKGI